MSENTALMIPNRPGMPSMDVSDAIERYRMLNSFVSQILRDGTDYGKIPGAGDKATLLKPGAEKLSMFFGLAPTFEHVRTVEDWTGQEHGGEPFFYYLVKCRLVKHGEIMGEGDGSCNSHESKYRYRSGERVCPHCGKPTIIKGREEYGGGWICFAKKGGCGAKFKDIDPDITGQQTGRVLNPDPADQVNTILKMAEKRALIAATLITVNASDYFTQDIEDLPGFGEIVETHVRIVEPEKRQATPPAAEPEPPSDAEFRKLTSASEERGAQGKPQRLAANHAIMLYGPQAAAFAAEFPAYRTKAGVFDDGHIRASILSLGFEEITPGNIEAAFAKLAEHALSKEADAAQAAAGK